MIAEALDYLTAQGGHSLLALFWYVIVFEIPRYTFLAILVAFVPRRPTGEVPDLRVSLVVVGHSEEHTIVRCIDAMHEQSRPPDEIIVISDGSSDRMAERISGLRRAGRVDQAHHTDLRSGKSAGINLGCRFASGDIVIVADCDCTFDRHAIREILRPFSDRDVGAVGGQVTVRNAWKSLVTRFQTIEYMISISLGRQGQDRIGQVTCVSGAFGAFRRSAILGIGGFDSGGGEDLDLTLRLRQRGWKVRFAAYAICHTDAPATRDTLVRQRLRWERDAIRLRFRKHGRLAARAPIGHRFTELLHEVEFLVLHVIAVAALPAYWVWILHIYGAPGITVIAAAHLGMMTLDAITFALAASVTRQERAGVLALFVPGYSIFFTYMRLVRLSAYLQEWIFRASYRDSYVPAKVQKIRL